MEEDRAHYAVTVRTAAPASHANFPPSAERLAALFFRSEDKLRAGTMYDLAGWAWRSSEAWRQEASFRSKTCCPQAAHSLSFWRAI